MNNELVISKTPLRVSFVGGGTDMPYFFNKYEGSTISCSINKYIYVTVKYHNNFNEKYRLNYSSTENVEKIKDIKNLRVKSALKYLKIDKPIYINTFSDIPAQTGMGSSSAFTVGLLTALFKLKKKKINKKKIAELAFKIESEITKNSVGKQDHYIAAYGGLKYIRYTKNKVKVMNLNQNIKINKFIKNLIILWTNNTRSAVNILEDQKTNKSKNSQDLMAINELTKKFLKTIKSKKSNIFDLFNIIKQSWKIKKKLSKLITNKRIENMFKNLTKISVYPGKILGAGNGGFILCFVDSSKKKKMLKSLKRYKYYEFKIEHQGSKII